jgi:uncharacterized membrane protein (DUF2068 family)
VSRAIKIVAAIEACKGLVVLLAATAILSLVHKDVHALALSLVEHLHLNPASKYPQIFVLAADDLKNVRLLLLATGAVGYSALRFVEAYGLLREKTWAEILAAGSGAIYVPFEILALMRKPSAFHWSLLLVNLVVVAVMVHALVRRGRGRPSGGGRSEAV